MSAVTRTKGEAAGTGRATLPGGSLLLVEPSHAIPLVSMVVALRSGATHDPDGKEGLLRATLRMLRRGARGLSAQQIEDALDRLGAELSVEVSASSATVYAQVIGRNLEPFLELFATLLGAPTFPDDELARLKRETSAEIVESRDNDRALAQRAFRRAFFRGHAYARSSSGTVRTVESFTSDDVKKAYAEHLRSENLVVAFSGDITREASERAATRLLQGVAAGAGPVDRVGAPEEPKGRRLVFVDKPERTQTQIVIGALGTHGHDPDHMALSVANAVFGGTFTSRLMREVRSKRGWSYGAAARLGLDRQRHAFTMWTFPAATDCAPCIELELDLLERFVNDGITARELAFIQRYLARSYAFEVDTASKRVQQALDVELLGLPADYFTRHVESVQGVTLEQANRAVKDRLHPENLVVTVVGTASEILDGVKGKIPRLASHEIVPFDQD